LPKPVCIPCQREMQMSSLGVEVGFTARGSDRTKPQTMYQVWACDIYTCPGCGSRVAARFSMKPSWERHCGRLAPSREDLAAMVPE
jgi:hypothetical protein